MPLAIFLHVNESRISSSLINVRKIRILFIRADLFECLREFVIQTIQTKILHILFFIKKVFALILRGLVMASVAKTHDETHNADVVEHNNCNTNCNLSTISDINSNIKNQQLSNNNKKLHQSPTESVENFPLKCNKSEAGEKNENEDDQKGVSDCVENIINTSEPIANESAEKETKNKLATTVTDAENVNFSNTQANTMRLAVHDDEQLSRGTERDIDTYSTTANKYIAPEQALVTRVELVVAAPTAPTSLMDTILPLSNSESQYNTNVLFNTDTILSSSATVSNSSKNNGCEPDSSLNLNVRIPTNITTTAGDILITDRRPASIWAPHGQDDQGQHQGHHHQSQGTEKTKESSNVNLICNSGGYKSDIFRSHEQQHHHYHQGHSTELLLQIEKATATSADCFGAQINTIEHHNFCQQQQPSSAQNHQQHNIFPQMVQHPHPHQQHHQLQHPHHNIHQETMHNQQLPIHYADYSHQQYAHDQLFEIHHNHNQSHHHEQLQQEQQHQARLLHQRHIEYQGHLQQQQPIQQHSHHQQMQDASYHDLIMDEFHEDACLAYKLTLSPSNPKPESQDDGYETSAGDVLTPNSHTSSTHSVTPQHQMQHSNLGLVTQTKHDDPMSSKNSEQMQSIATNSNSPQVQVQSARLPHLNTVSQIENSSIANNVKVSLPNDPYSFISEDISILSPRARGHHSVDLPATSNASSYTPAPVSGSASDSTQPSDVYNINDNHQQQLEQQQPKSELVPESFEMKVKSKSTDVTNVICEINPSSQETVPKRRGRKKKINAAESVQIISQQCDERNSGLPAVDIQTTKPRERKKHDRFNGMSEADVIKRTIPDHLCDNLDIVIVGINPGLFAAYKGHHYAGPGNHFWKCLYLSGLTQEQMSADDDYTLLKQGIGFTNMVARATKGSADLTRKEIKEGSRILLEKLQRFQPKVAVFNGKLIFEVFSGKKEFHFGRQPDRVDGTNTYIWVMPSSSARCAQLPRAADKVPFYTALKKFRDFLNGLIPHLDESECVFTEQRIRQCCEQQEQLNSLSTPISSANTNHVEQQQPSNLMYGDGNMGGSNNMNASTICRNQSENQSLPHFTNQSQNSPTIVPRGGFIYGGNDESPKVSINDQNYLCVFGNQQQPQQQPQPQQPLLPEKKKRGRPKKIKEQEIIDSSSGSKVQQGQSMPQHDFNNILNLSMIAASNSSSGVGASATGETPTKKKRGRPKKLKPTIESMLSTANSKQQLQHHKVTHRTANSTPQQTTPSSMQAMSMSPQNSHQPPSLYNTPPPSHLLYTASASPMASPALNCSYTTHSHGTPPVGAQVDPNFQQNTEDHQANQTNQVVDAVVRDQPHLGETPPPSSPQMCSADFGQPNSDELANVARGQESNSILMPRQSPVSLDKLHVPDHYQHWLASSQSQKNSQPLQLKSQARLSPVPVVHYSQAPHAPLNYQSDNQADQWQRYEEQARPYSMLASPHHQQHPHVNLSPQLSNLAGQLEIQTQISASDVSRKSLSGLESLVDQIPSISEHESNVISSATVSAAAAAVESRLLGLQHQKRCQPDNDNTHSENTTANQNNNSVTNNFSVSSLAESAALPTSIENHLGHNNNASKRPESGLNNNNSIEYSSQSTTGYPHHASHLTATISNQAPLSHPLPHPQMYMDHAHITSHMAHMPSVNVNALYGGSPYGPQHGSSAPEYAHGHYSVVQGATPTLHVPSPNYPYTHYSPHTPPQNNYTGFAHSHHHPHHHHHGHAAHHLSVFDRLKPSDISGYNGF